MFDYMARSFMAVIKPLLEESEEGWNSAISLAWQSLFQLIVYGILVFLAIRKCKIR